MPSSKRLRTSNLTSGLAGTKIKNSACSYLEPAQILIQFKISTIYSCCQLIISIYCAALFGFKNSDTKYASYTSSSFGPVSFSGSAG